MSISVSCSSRSFAFWGHAGYPAKVACAAVVLRRSYGFVLVDSTFFGVGSLDILECRLTVVVASISLRTMHVSIILQESLDFLLEFTRWYPFSYTSYLRNRLFFEAISLS